MAFLYKIEYIKIVCIIKLFKKVKRDNNNKKLKLSIFL